MQNRRSPYEILVNIRFGQFHLFMTRNGAISLTTNPGHAWHREWWPPKFWNGEFRAKTGWKWVQIYRIGAWAPRRPFP